MGLLRATNAEVGGEFLGGGTQNLCGSAAISSPRSCRGQRTAKDVWSSGTVTNIRPAFHAHLARVLTAQEPQERFHSVLDTLDDSLR
jgi:hypothetical protein